LKRARDQTARPGGGAGSPRAGEDPWSYAPLPERRRRGSLAVGAAATAGIALAAAIVFVASRPRRAGTPPDARPPASMATPALATPDRSAGTGGLPVAVFALPSPTPLPAAPPPRMPAAGARSAGRALPVAASEEILSGDPGLASASPRVAAPARASRTLLSGDVHPGQGQRLPAAAGRTYLGSLVAPGGARIELGGIVFSESPVALLNGRVLPVGGFIEGLRIVAIEENRVELSGEGFTAFLALK